VREKVEKVEKVEMVEMVTTPTRPTTPARAGASVTSYQAAAARMRDWLDAHFDADGRCVLDAGDARYYYKAPYLLALAGLRAKGARVAKYVRDHLLTPEGELTGPAAFGRDQRIYGMGWLAFGAVATERFDLAGILGARLAALQDTTSGGFLLPDADAGEPVAEVCFSAGAGMGLAAAGRLAAARRLADRLVALLAMQAGQPRYYNRFRRDGTVVARPAPGAWQKMYSLTEDEQRPANFATVVLALVWTARATGEGRYVEAATGYVDYTYRHRLDPAQFGRATKFGYAMLQLYDETGDQRLLDRARHLGDVLVAHQAEDGLWEPRPASGAPAAPYERLSASADCACTIFGLAGLP
jgi:hypothetical protein